MERVADPIAAFIKTFETVRATAPGSYEPEAATFATADGSCRPSARIVLVKSVTEQGFTFFTDYASRKGRELDVNPHGALCFWWFWLEQQVRVEGEVVRISPAESNRYFATRPRGSQIGAHASKQSDPLDSRAHLEAAYHAAQATFEGQDVPRPAHWGGYRLVPAYVEFWHAGVNRLHDRWAYTRSADGSWSVQRLFP